MTDQSTVKRGVKRGGEFSRKFRPNIFPASVPSLYRATTVFDTSVFLTALRLVYPRLSASGPIYPTRHVRLQTAFLNVFYFFH